MPDYRHFSVMTSIGPQGPGVRCPWDYNVNLVYLFIVFGIIFLAPWFVLISVLSPVPVQLLPLVSPLYSDLPGCDFCSYCLYPLWMSQFLFSDLLHLFKVLHSLFIQLPSHLIYFCYVYLSKELVMICYQLMFVFLITQKWRSPLYPFLWCFDFVCHISFCSLYSTVAVPSPSTSSSVIHSFSFLGVLTPLFSSSCTRLGWGIPIASHEVWCPSVVFLIFIVITSFLLILNFFIIPITFIIIFGGLFFLPLRHSVERNCNCILFPHSVSTIQRVSQYLVYYWQPKYVLFL